MFKNVCQCIFLQFKQSIYCLLVAVKELKETEIKTRKLEYCNRWKALYTDSKFIIVCKLVMMILYVPFFLSFFNVSSNPDCRATYICAPSSALSYTHFQLNKTNPES